MTTTRAPSADPSVAKSAGSATSAVLPARKRLLMAWAFLLPNFLGFLVFTAAPVLFSLYMAFTDWSLIKHNDLTNEPPNFIWFENFERILWGDESRLFWKSFYNTIYLMIGIPIGIAGSLIVALMLNRPIGPKRSSSRIMTALLALVLGVITGFGSYLMTNPGPTPTNPDIESQLVEQGRDATPAAINQIRQHHEVQVRSSKAIASLFVILGLVVAASLITGVVFFRTLFYLPSLLAGIALFLLWKSLYKPTGGAINEALTPLCNSLQSFVISTPTGLWYVMGGLVCAITLIGVSWAMFSVIVKLQNGDFGSGSALGALLALLCLAAVGLGFAYTACQLPRDALFRTGYAPLTSEAVGTIRDQLLVTDLPIDPREIEMAVYTVGETPKPATMISALTSLLPPTDATAEMQDMVRAIVMQHAEPLYEGYTAGDGLQPPKWLVDETWAKPALIVMGIWTTVGGANMLLYLAGLSNIPEELYEAAQIDGAGSWTRFWNVTWPQLAPTTFFIVIMSTIGGLQGGFDQVRAMTNGKYETDVLTFYLYQVAFTDEFQLGLASAIAWAMFAMIFVMTIINYRLGSKLVND